MIGFHCHPPHPILPLKCGQKVLVEAAGDLFWNSQNLCESLPLRVTLGFGLAWPQGEPWGKITSNGFWWLNGLMIVFFVVLTLVRGCHLTSHPSPPFLLLSSWCNFQHKCASCSWKGWDRILLRCPLDQGGCGQRLCISKHLSGDAELLWEPHMG